MNRKNITMEINDYSETICKIAKELLISMESCITCAESDAIRDIKYYLKALEATLSDIIIM